jgi:hypothetical protein
MLGHTADEGRQQEGRDREGPGQSQSQKEEMIATRTLELNTLEYSSCTPAYLKHE